jgi:hypothetical protein
MLFKSPPKVIAQLLVVVVSRDDNVTHVSPSTFNLLYTPLYSSTPLLLRHIIATASWNFPSFEVLCSMADLQRLDLGPHYISDPLTW